MCGTLVCSVSGSTADAAAMVHRDAGGIEIEPVGGADAAGREQQHFGGDVAAVGELDDDAAVAPCSIELTAEPRRSATLRSRSSCMNSSINSLSMKSRKVGRGSISVTATSSAEKIVAYSTPITPGADHRQAARQFRQIDDLVAVEHGLAVERHVVGPERPCAAGDQDK